MEIRAVKGMEDILPPESEKFQRIVSVFKKVMETANFKEVILPVVEREELFKRAVGEETDIVQKEMFSFTDKGGRKVVLRPEGTASAVRAYVENRVFQKEKQTRWFYVGPMFRYENPQAGRKRQFHQAGCELFGSRSPLTDAEVIYCGDKILKELKVKSVLELNSIGCEDCRSRYKEVLVDYLKNKSDNLCEDCKKRLERNPLRVLDCKNRSCRKTIEEGPVILEFLCENCTSYFEDVKSCLRSFGVEYEESPFLVRGLDYYTGTVFEFKVKELGAQDTVCAGGRYDNLVKFLGGPEVPAIGFALGIERTMLAIGEKPFERKGIFVAYPDEAGRKKAVEILKTLREKGILSVMGDSGKLKNQLKLADKQGFKFAVIVGENEVKTGKFTVKELESGKQFTVELSEIFTLPWKEGEF
jgi:histidyl-tRNA synthetase